MVKAQSVSGNFRILIKCERFCEGFASSTKGVLSLVPLEVWSSPLSHHLVCLVAKLDEEKIDKNSKNRPKNGTFFEST